MWVTYVRLFLRDEGGEQCYDRNKYILSMQSWLTSEHPLSFHVAAFAFAVLALITTFVSHGLAQETTSGTGDPAMATCSYSYSDWGSCQSEGQRYRTVTGTTPTGCVASTAPDIQDSCSYTAPTCSYTYSEWGSCQSNARQTRALVSTTPTGCNASTKPVLERSCTFIDTTTTTAIVTACSYTYSDWGSCQSEGKRYRSVTSTSPSGCVTSTSPTTQDSCTYTATENTGTTDTLFTIGGTTTESSGGTAGTTGEQCTYSYSSWAACQSNNKRQRFLSGKAPFGCVEYTKPVLEQSCVYDVVSGTTVAAGDTVDTTTHTTTTLQPTSDTETVNTGGTTPIFVFASVTDGQAWRDTVNILGQVSGAEAVEYYLVPVGSNTYRYIGSGRLEESKWRLSFRSTDIPNGEYYLRAKIKNQYGEYGSGQRRIQVLNQSTLLSAAQQSNSVEFRPVDESELRRRAFLVALTEEITKTDKQFQSVSAVPTEQKKQIMTYCEDRPEQCFPERDSDHDGLSDIDEIRFGTDPKGADSDWDGFIDGDEVKNGFDPAKYSPGDQSDRIVFESPKSAGEVKKNYVVETVVMKSDASGKSKMQLSGKGLPNSFVTIYIYSDPIVLTVKTDGDGNWTYELDKELGDGTHEAYVAITDNTGKITGKSEPIAFVKTAQAVTVIPTVDAATAVNARSVVEKRTGRDLLFIAAIIIAAVAIALSVIGFVRHRHVQKELMYLS